MGEDDEVVEVEEEEGDDDDDDADCKMCYKQSEVLVKNEECKYYLDKVYVKCCY